jgi:hypothetical protein
MKYIVLQKSRIKAHLRTRKGKLERVNEYNKVYHGTSADKVFDILFGGVKPQKFHNWNDNFYAGERAKRIFATYGKGSFEEAVFFAHKAETQNNKPSVVIEALIPNAYYKANVVKDSTSNKAFLPSSKRIKESIIARKVAEKLKLARELATTRISLPEIKPEWITNIYDKDGVVMTKTINSLTLERFDKSGKLVYIPLLLKLLKKILKKAEDDTKS